VAGGQRRGLGRFGDEGGGQKLRRFHQPDRGAVQVAAPVRCVTSGPFIGCFRSSAGSASASSQSVPTSGGITTRARSPS
jgi:hypothetical protein